MSDELALLAERRFIYRMPYQAAFEFIRGGSVFDMNCKQENYSFVLL